MYLSFYGLQEKPFNLTPDVHFLFPSKVHRDVLAHLLFGIEGRKGFILFTGEVGSGKTTICRAMLNEVGENTEVAFVINPFLSELELLKTINEDLGIQTKGKTKKELIDELNRFLMDARTADKNVVIIIDEAQNLSLPVLEEIRMLGNLETQKEKLLQIALVGQPELRKTLNSPQLKQLNQRIAVRCRLRALTRQEVEHYIYHRLRAAGSRGDIAFSPKAINRIYKHSSGIPRLINVICDHCLLIGYVENTMTITASIVRRAVNEVSGTRKEHYPLYSRLQTLVKITAAVMLLVVLAIAAKLVISVGKSDRFRSLNTATSHRKPKDAPQRPAVSEAKPSQAHSQKVAVRSQRKVSMAADMPSLLLTAVELDRAGYLDFRIASTSDKSDAGDKVFRGTSSNRPGPVKSNSAALVEDILEIWGIPSERIRRVMTAIGSSFDPDTDLVHIYELASMGVVETMCDVSLLLKINTPALIQIKDSSSERTRYVLLDSIIDKKVVLYTPEHKITLDLSALAKVFTGRAVFVADNTFLNPLSLHNGLGVSLEIRKLQEILKKHGDFDGNLNGQFTAGTKQAVVDFQRAHQLPATGVVDVKTKLMLYFLLTDTRIPRLDRGS